MTYIPGTGTLTPKNTPVAVQNTPDVPKPISVVNIDELKKPVNKEYYEEDELWYNQLKYWILFGCIGSGAFALFAFINQKALFLLPLGPYIAYVSWHARRWFRKHSKSFDSFS